VIYTANWHNFTFLIPHPNPPPLGEGVYEKRRLCQFAVYTDMIIADTTRNYFPTIQFRVRKAVAESRSSVAYTYEDEPFFTAYESISLVWQKRKPQMPNPWPSAGIP